MMNIVLVFVGGGIGASLRYWASGFVYRWMGSEFPYGTIMENVIGCFLIGLLMSAFEDRFLVQPSLRVFLTVGILGGFTTFSTFSFETISLVRSGEFFSAMLNVVVTVVVCLGMTYVGTVSGKLL